MFPFPDNHGNRFRCPNYSFFVLYQKENNSRPKVVCLIVNECSLK